MSYPLPVPSSDVDTEEKVNLRDIRANILPMLPDFNAELKHVAKELYRSSTGGPKCRQFEEKWNIQLAYKPSDDGTLYPIYSSIFPPVAVTFGNFIDPNFKNIMMDERGDPNEAHEIIDLIFDKKKRNPLFRKKKRSWKEWKQITEDYVAYKYQGISIYEIAKRKGKISGRVRLGTKDADKMKRLHNKITKNIDLLKNLIDVPPVYPLFPQAKKEGMNN